MTDKTAPSQEPVAWISRNTKTDECVIARSKVTSKYEGLYEWQPLYTTQPDAAAQIKMLESIATFAQADNAAKKEQIAKLERDIEVYRNSYNLLAEKATPSQEPVAECRDDKEGGVYYVTLTNDAPIGLLYLHPSDAAAQIAELQTQLNYEPKYKQAYIELSGKTGELEDQITELTNEVCKVQSERDHYHYERDIWVRSNKKQQEQIAKLEEQLRIMRNGVLSDRHYIALADGKIAKLEAELSDQIAGNKVIYYQLMKLKGEK